MSDLTGIFTCRLKPSVNAEEFERFMHTELLPAYRNLPGCLEANLLRACKNSSADLYISISRWESLEANDAVFGPQGTLPPAYVGVQQRLHDFVSETGWIGYVPC